MADHRLAAVAVGPARHDPQRMAVRYAAPVCEVFAYAPPPIPDPPGAIWRGYAMYPAAVLDALADARWEAMLRPGLVALGIEVADA